MRETVGAFQEVVVYDAPTRTLLVTDLVVSVGGGASLVPFPGVLATSVLQWFAMGKPLVFALFYILFFFKNYATNCRM